MQRKIFYRYMSNYKLDLIKGIIWILLLFNSRKLYSFFYLSVKNKYGKYNIDYIFQITVILSTFLLIISGVITLFRFLTSNAESLLLLGLSETDVLKLFFVKYYDFFLGYIYIKCLLSMFYRMNYVKMLAISLLDACIIGLLMILFYTVVQNRYVRSAFYFVLIVISLFFAMGKINYENAFEIITSELMHSIFYDVSWMSVGCKILVMIFLHSIFYNNLKRKGIVPDVYNSNQENLNKVGDLFHKGEKYSTLRINYLWMYRDHDFLIWKIFSTIVFVFICLQCKNIYKIVLCGYVIGLISTSYFLNIYRMERKRLIVYYMSDFSFLDFLKIHIKSSLFIAGDNIILVLVLNTLRNYIYLSAMLILCVQLFLMVLFIDTAIYSKYPRDIYIFDLIFIIVKMHIPVYNVSKWYQNYLDGERKWAELEYGKE